MAGRYPPTLDDEVFVDAADHERRGWRKRKMAAKLLARGEAGCARLSTTAHRDRFILKGAMLMAAWLDDAFRPTRDIDLLGVAEVDAEAMLAVLREVCGVVQDDAVEFDVAGMRVDLIREELEYGGLRLKTTATVGGARVRVVIDIGFGDAVEPEAAEMALPVFLDLPSPRLRAYARETVIAEKFQAMVALGRANSRMKRGAVRDHGRAPSLCTL